MFRRTWSAPTLALLLSFVVGAARVLPAQTVLAAAPAGAPAPLPPLPPGPALDRVFTAHLKDVTLREALAHISGATGAHFVYSGPVVVADRRVSLDATNMSVREALATLFARAAIVFVPAESDVIRLEAKAPVPLDNGTISGHVTDSAGHPLQGASVTIVGNTRFGGYSGSDGSYVITEVPAGAYRLAAHFIGFRTDTVTVTVTGGQTVTQDIALKAVPTTLNTVVITSPRMNETVAGALQEQKDADNIVSVQSGDQIRSLPNYNAAEALARMPGVTAERDEGEGKYVEIRGTPPDFQHVTIDGADVPGTLATDVRAVKLDDVPADVLGAIEVNKTLSADIDADAIGGSVNLVTKVPEGAPQGYASGYYGYQTLLSNNNGHGDLSYGGRVGTGQKFGFLFGGSIDRTNRVINDVEPSYTGEILDPTSSCGKDCTNYMGVPGSTYDHVQASSWSQREYDYFRTRYGLSQDLDYRFSPTSSVYLKGLWSAFFDEANRWETNLSAGGDALIAGVPTATGASVGNTVSNRGPIEHTWGFTGGGKQSLGNVQLTYAANYAGSTANQHAHFQDDYTLNGPNTGSGFNYTYSANNLIPRYFVSPGVKSDILTASDYDLTQLETDYEQNSGAIVGAKADALVPYSIGQLPSSTKFGVKIENQHKGYLSFQPDYTPNGTLTLANFPSGYSDPNFYSSICGGCYQLAPFSNLASVNRNLVNNPAGWTFVSNGVSDSLATFAGTEQTNAAYVMQTMDVSKLHINAGLRVENTNVGYVGYMEDTSGAIGTARVHGSSSYTDLFPSVQLKYEIDENTNLRAAVTRGIARPDYALLAPSINVAGVLGQGEQSPISEGNPALKPEHAWNYDLLAEHYLSSVGVLSGGVFYKAINDFIFQRIVPYTGPLADGVANTWIEQPENGPTATLWGAEIDYMQHLTFLPGVLRGIGFDVNYTHVESRAIVPQDTTFADVGYVDPVTGDSINQFKGQPYRHAALPRQFPDLFNVSLLYDYSAITARITGQYTSASIYQYGSNGTSSPQNGDNYNYAHFQIDAAASYTVFGRSAITLQVLNMTNAVFGFFTGTTAHPWNNQREYYGTTVFLGYRQGL